MAERARMLPMDTNASSRSRSRPLRLGTSRPKPRLSCQACRDKKLKCDRQNPCSNCAKQAGVQCLYVQPDSLASIDKTKRAYKSARDDGRVSVVEHHLAQILSSLHDPVLQAGSGEQFPTNGRAEKYSNISLQDDDDDGASSQHFTSADQWEGVLTQIAALQQEVASIRHRAFQEQQDHAYTASKDFELLLPRNAELSVEELRHIPVTQSAAAELINLLANDQYSGWLAVVVHFPTMQSQVTGHFSNVGSAGLPWLALLYGILSIGLYVAYRSQILIPDVGDLERASHLCMVRATHCLRKSLYCKPTSDTITAMIVYLASEHNWLDNKNFEASVILGIIIRLAMRLGYHRDPDLFPNITPFHAEMRRRNWAFIVQLDHLLSRKCGLPAMVDRSKTDTLAPREINDNDLQLDMNSLPSHQNHAFLSEIVALNIKSRISVVQKRIDSLNQCDFPLNDQNIIEIDQELRSLSQSIPPWLRLSQSSGWSLESGRQGNQKVDIELMISTARMMLHRRYIIPSRVTPGYQASRDTCLYAAESILHIQQALFASSDDRSLRENWRFISLVEHDFLLAAMLICLDMDQELQQGNKETWHSSNISAQKDQERSQRLSLLRTAQQFWENFGEHRRSGKQAAEILHKLIDRFTSGPSGSQKTRKDDSVEGFAMRINETPSEGHVPQNDHSWSFPTMPLPSTTTTIALSERLDPITTSIDEYAPAVSMQHIDSFPSTIGFDPNYAQIQELLDDSEINLDWSSLMNSGPEFYDQNAEGLDWNDIDL